MASSLVAILRPQVARSYPPIASAVQTSWKRFASNDKQPLNPNHATQDQNVKESSIPSSSAEAPLTTSDTTSSQIPNSQNDSIPTTPLDGPLDPTMLGSEQPTAPKAQPPVRAGPSLASSYLDLTEVSASREEREAAARTEGAFPGRPHRARGGTAKRSLSSIEKKRQMVARGTMVGALLGLGIGAWYLGRDWESEREALRLSEGQPTPPGLAGRYFRGKARFMDVLDVSILFALSMIRRITISTDSTLINRPGIPYYRLNFLHRTKNL